MDEGTVRVDRQFLDQLHRSISEAALDLGIGTMIPRSDLSRATEVQQAWNELYERWNENQKRISDALHIVAEAVRTIRDSFCETDTTLASDIDGSR